LTHNPPSPILAIFESEFLSLILAAADEGLGTCWIAAFDPKAARRTLNIPNNWEPIAFTPLGYLADKWNEKRRKKIDDIVLYMK
jgi:nitroreductase